MGRGRRRLSASLLLLAGCTRAPSPTTVTPPPIPLEAFFANRDTSYDHKVSPDGTRLAWIGMAEGRLTVHVRRLDGDDVVALDTHSRRSIQSFVWAQDSRRILYGQDRDGDENTHVFVADTERPRERPRDLTPFAGQRAFVQQVIRSDAEHIVVGVNRPRTALADLHRIALTTGERTRIVDNTGDVLTWMTDDDGVVRARIRREAPGARVLERVRPDSARWEPLFTLDGEEYARAVGFTTDRAGLWLLTNQGRDRYALVRLDLATGITAVAHEHAVVDVETAGVSTLTGQPLFAIAHPDYPESRVFDATLSSDLAPLGEPGPAEVRILSLDDAERLATVRVSRDRGREHHLLDRRTGTRTLLSRSAMAPYADRLARVEPISLTSRDGLTLRGYLTRPPGARARVPMVLLVHGGPWTRDYWGYNGTVQFLASRGWAVLQLNYRASTGYGRAFVEAGVRQHAGAIHADLLDGVRWAVEQGIADPARVAIMGASYGGYATLVGLTFTPEVFACGVDLFGMSNLVTQLEGRPSYWTWSFFEPYYRKYYGDVSRPEDRQRLEAQSPLFRAADVRRPVLVIHGANDPNVKQRESDQMVAALRAAGKDVQYLVLADEGHGAFGDPASALRMYRAIEQFLGACLGP
ncbi:MAG: S9 family peptidase [Candidatus Rokuibacteriota bacterium]|nr:MAG: S9 family peptidase [Candidatus Rokubacteria bacterium]